MRLITICTVAALAVVGFGQGRPTPLGQRTEPPQRSAPEAPAKSDARARQLLQRAISRQPIFNVRAIIIQRLDYSNPLMQSIKVEMSTDRKVHQIVLAPLRIAGQELVDDGVSTKTYS